MRVRSLDPFPDLWWARWRQTVRSRPTPRCGLRVPPVGIPWLNSCFGPRRRRPGPIVLIGMAVGGTSTKVGRGEGSSMLPLGAVVFTLLACGMVGFPLAMLRLLFLGMGLFMAFKLAYL